MEKQNITELQLELTTHCNSNCKMCVRDQLKRPLGFIDLNFAKKVIDDGYDLGARLLKAQWFGESLMSKDWMDITKYAKEKGMKIMLITNGSLMTDEYINHTIKYIDKVIFSIDHQEDYIYEEIRRGLSFENVICNLKTLYKERNLSESKTKIIVSAVRNADLIDEDFKKFMLEFSDQVIINDDCITIKWDKKDRLINCRNNVNSRIVISWDGKVYLCCHDWLGNHLIGDIKRDSMKDIWNGIIRKQYLNNLKNLDLCKKCMQSLEQ